MIAKVCIYRETE